MPITLHPHCVEAAAKKNLPVEAVEFVANHPSITYPSFRKDDTGKRVPYTCKRCGVQQMKYTGTFAGKSVCVTVNECCGVAITCWEDQIETALRPDQKAAGVKGYRDRNGFWCRG